MLTRKNKYSGKLELPKKLQRLNKPKRFKVAYGGRGSAKSHGFARKHIIHACSGKKISCFREYKNSLQKSVYPLIRSIIKDYHIPGFRSYKGSLLNDITGGQFDFEGISRDIEVVRGFEGYNFFWLEEGQFISEEKLRVMTPTLRASGSELWISGNPLSSNDAFSKRFILPFIKHLEKKEYFEDDLHTIIKINYRDNPWFPAALEQERKYDEEHLSKALYEHIWEGAFNDSVPNNIITAEHFDAAINAHEKLGFKPLGIKVLSHDPSDTGEDDKACVIRHGSVVTLAENEEYGDVNTGCDWAIDTALNNDVDLFTWDCDGLGSGLKRQVSNALKGKHTKIKMFYGSKAPEYAKDIYKPVEKMQQREKTNAETFKNRRAQYYWKLRDRFYNTFLAVEKNKYIDPDKLISISPSISDIKMLRSEICRIPRKYNDQGTIQIMSKPDMKRIKIQSPNLADALMMSFTEKKEEVDSTINFDSFF